uniref:Uncharacterized protein n=1 Tax=Daphnia magna TaxID=35525 RepID=A0A0P6IHK4_9CRUS
MNTQHAAYTQRGQCQQVLGYYYYYYNVCDQRRYRETKRAQNIFTGSLVCSLTHTPTHKNTI